jgi:hypothetical protein
MQKHVTVVAVLHIGLGILGLMVALIMVTILIGSGIIADDPIALGVLVTLGVLYVVIMAALALPAIIGGIGLLGHKRWARYVILIVAALDIFVIVNALIGIYSLWILVQDETVELFSPPEES